eukprot:Pompholyxophrys_punicea_v1_NODE_57_length_4146_cov_6.766521.p4 type:complete len:136 gc:universal NODE_57_length_4146_cov_6.766521:1540-1947(+)
MQMEKEKYSCEFFGCDYRFRNDFSQFIFHLKCHEDGVKQFYKCRLCKAKSYTNLIAFKRHCRDDHDHDDISVEALLEVNVCPHNSLHTVPTSFDSEAEFFNSETNNVIFILPSLNLKDCRRMEVILILLMFKLQN